ncbi:MAG: DNA-binding protein [Desulfovibrionales bacterium]|nr:DNA-binding protein [Desulfovibrionales bacterium]
MSLSFLPEDMDWICEPCGQKLVPGKAELNYLGNAFQVELPVCPQCGAVFVFEALAQGRILEVEQLLEDK